ncbi:MAG TPA: hypothetical protein VM802_21845 [Chitinophaga sp.]|uniref:hypothetical protein n=1 Tax=Chitinophaga sp. TaxID=1869181 RepID=UPI002BA3C8E5|nr:hypothetical protein [Chitinophaga sp.]HVI47529.1 hypothetical protein [Chitinophaga sp.]
MKKQQFPKISDAKFTTLTLTKSQKNNVRGRGWCIGDATYSGPTGMDVVVMIDKDGYAITKDIPGNWA